MKSNSASSGSEEVAATADLTPHESENREDGTDQQQDDPNGPEDRDLREEPHDQ
jgi:hypothetical protein